MAIRLRSLGDCVLTTPALHLLKSYRPDIRLGVMVEERFAGVFTGNPDVDSILPPAFSAAWRFRPDLTINLHGGARSAWLTLATSARKRAGFAHYRYLPWIYNVRFPRAQQILGCERKVHTAEHVASAVFYLGVPQSEVPRSRLFTTKGSPVGGNYAVLHPFASAVSKAWPASRFVAVARHLETQHRLTVVILGGPGDDVTPFQSFRVLSNAPLEEVKAVLAGASIFVGNDSGPAHMAAAFGIPVVVLFGSSDPVVWAPWKTQAETIVAAEGLASVKVASVIAAADRLRVAP